MTQGSAAGDNAIAIDAKLQVASRRFLALREHLHVGQKSNSAAARFLKPATSPELAEFIEAVNALKMWGVGAPNEANKIAAAEFAEPLLSIRRYVAMHPIALPSALAALHLARPAEDVSANLVEIALLMWASRAKRGTDLLSAQVPSTPSVRAFDHQHGFESGAAAWQDCWDCLKRDHCLAECITYLDPILPANPSSAAGGSWQTSSSATGALSKQELVLCVDLFLSRAEGLKDPMTAAYRRRPQRPADLPQVITQRRRLTTDCCGYLLFAGRLLSLVGSPTLGKRWAQRLLAIAGWSEPITAGVASHVADSIGIASTG